MRGPPLARALDHILPLLRTRVLPALAQLLALLLRQALELAVILTCRLLARRRQRAKLFPAPLQLLPALRRQLLKFIEALPGRGGALELTVAGSATSVVAAVGAVGAAAATAAAGARQRQPALAEHVAGAACRGPAALQ